MFVRMEAAWTSLHDYEGLALSSPACSLGTELLLQLYLEGNAEAARGFWSSLLLRWGHTVAAMGNARSAGQTEW